MSRAVQPEISPPLQLWGGVECTVNRVGDRYFDQFTHSCHHLRPDDIDRFADLGLSALRIPILWERVAPDGLASADWSWPDEVLDRANLRGIRPIVTLLHHGSGPADTHLLDPGFPEKLAVFAGAVAKRYPWVLDYTPINEPFTTARFSALYGHWYPHERSMQACVLATMSQVKAISAAMRAIRDVNPRARLVQTEDIGKTYSTPELAYQAEFENHRRFLSLDLLFGRIDPEHPLWGYLQWLGIPSVDLLAVRDVARPPDLVGINHYITSERFLDQRLRRYPVETHGSNGRRKYADVEAVRVRAGGVSGLEMAVTDVWERYATPIAVTEVHIGCTREEQLRWLQGAWNTANRLRDAGINLQAITSWALLGTWHWDRLLTDENGSYEPGAFSLAQGELQPTALANLIHTLARGGHPNHPLLQTPGWWERPERLLYPPVGADGRDVSVSMSAAVMHAARTLRVDGKGPMAALVAGQCLMRGTAVDDHPDTRFSPQLHWAQVTVSTHRSGMLAEMHQSQGLPRLALHLSSSVDGGEFHRFLNDSLDQLIDVSFETWSDAAGREPEKSGHATRELKGASRI